MGSIEKNLKELKSGLPEGTTLVAVSKYRPLEQLWEAYGAGQRVFAESRPLEFCNKALTLPQDIEWHFIGHLQTNKLKLVLPYVHLVHSVDSLHQMDAIQKWGTANGRTVNILLEVHIGREENKQGFSEEETFSTAEKISNGRFPNISLRGLMGMASHTDDVTVIEGDFARIESLFHKIQSALPALTDFRELSIGMSADWKIAIGHGATMVRIGTAVFE